MLSTLGLLEHPSLFIAAPGSLTFLAFYYTELLLLCILIINI